MNTAKVEFKRICGDKFDLESTEMKNFVEKYIHVKAYNDNNTIMVTVGVRYIGNCLMSLPVDGSYLVDVSDEGDWYESHDIVILKSSSQKDNKFKIMDEYKTIPLSSYIETDMEQDITGDKPYTEKDFLLEIEEWGLKTALQSLVTRNKKLTIKIEDTEETNEITDAMFDCIGDEDVQRRLN